MPFFNFFSAGQLVSGIFCGNVEAADGADHCCDVWLSECGFEGTNNKITTNKIKTTTQMSFKLMKIAPKQKSTMSADFS